jgi:hypothetical protein
MRHNSYTSFVFSKLIDNQLASLYRYNYFLEAVKWNDFFFSHQARGYFCIAYDVITNMVEKAATTYFKVLWQRSRG